MTGYKLIRSRRKTIGVSVGISGEVTVRAPVGVPANAIDKFVSDSAGWIEKQREKAASAAAEAVCAGMLGRDDIEELKNRMRRELPPRVERYAAMLGVSFGRIGVRCQRSKWGSCAADGNLNFNCLLMLAPESVLDYVVVHELCHRRHMDHSPAFWADVERALPDFKARRAWLKKNGARLMARVERD